MPVLSSMPSKRWQHLNAAVENGSGHTCVVAYTEVDTADNWNREYDIRYTIDTKRWLILAITRAIQDYEAFKGTYRYEFMDGTPVLTAIALRDDTSFARGGYRFFNIEVNSDLDDTLFTGLILTERQLPREPSRPVTAFSDRASGQYDLLGRAIHRNAGGTRAASFIIERSGSRMHNPSRSLRRR